MREGERVWLRAGGRTGTARTRTRVLLVRSRRRGREEEGEEGREGGMVVASLLEETRPVQLCSGGGDREG